MIVATTVLLTLALLAIAALVVDVLLTVWQRNTDRAWQLFVIVMLALILAFGVWLVSTARQSEVPPDVYRAQTVVIEA